MGFTTRQLDTRRHAGHPVRYKVQWYDRRSMCWREVQYSWLSLSLARVEAPQWLPSRDAEHRFVRIERGKARQVDS